MAQTQTVSEAPASAPPPSFPAPEPRRRGRGAPKAPPDPGEAATTPAEAPKQGFFQRLRTATPVDWERYIVYLYRTDPIVDTTAGGTKYKYIGKFTQPFDEDAVMKEFGSGGYRADWNERIGTKEKTIQQHYFAIENVKFPPRIARGSWLDDPRNQKWVNWFPADSSAAPAPPTGMSANEAFEFARNLIKEVRPDASANTQQQMVTAVLDAIRETRRELADQQKPTDWTAILTAVMPLVLALVNRNSGSDPVLQAIQRQNDLLLRSIEKRSSPFGELKEMVEAMSLMRTEFGGGGDSTPAWLQAIPGIAQMFMARPGMPPPMQATPQFAPQPAIPQEPQDMPQQQAYSPEQIQFISQLVMNNALSMFKFFDGDRSGQDYADYFVEGNSLASFEVLKAFGFENLVRLIQQNPMAWQQIAPKLQQFEAFMADFYAWTPKPDTDESPAA